ncbi:UDP-glycosyltransferase 87A2-like isoform X2 [Ananas comosus]|uniref:Glycosyltransferase n=1 Tax=Ananas comosus TaxID=4615 RepID=A0A6P5GTT8_ANACO|nr:UDP-glycosyltransferase 87A2-like isoform X2 [Ananas comosus]
MAQSNSHPHSMESTTHLEKSNSNSNNNGASSSSSSSSSRPLLHVVAIPFPGRGHIHPMLALARRLASRGLLVTLLLTPEWLRLLSPTTTTTTTTTTTNPNPNPSSVNGDEGLLRLRAIRGVALPSERARGAAYAAFARAVLADMAAPAEAAAAAAGVEGPAVDLVVADALLPWAPAIARRRGVPAAALFPQSASVLRALLALGDGDGDGDGDATHNLCDQEERLQALKYNPRGSSPHLPDFTTLCFGQSMHTTFLNIISWLPTAHSLLLNSLHDLEPHALASLSSILPLPLHPIAPSFPHLPTNTTTNNNYDASPQPHYFQWLSSHPPNSILYVSLGSFLPLSKQEVKELALGLKLSGHPFLWSMRTEEEDDDVGGVAGVGEKGMVVPWCEQSRVLCHPSVGGFLTHCGWNSTLEGLYAGVPMLTYPLVWDQYPNSKMVVDEWGVGLRVKEDDGGGVRGEVVAELVRKVMDLEDGESKEMRRRARELKEMCHRALEEEEEGSSMRSIDAFVNDIVMHCKGGKRG